MTKVKVSAVQYKYKPINSFEEFASNVTDLVNQAKGSDFVVFPEAFTLELQYLIPDNKVSKIIQFTEEYVKLFEQLSQERKQYIVAGSHFTVVKGKVYNTGHIFCPDGQLFKHSKTHIMPFEVSSGLTRGNTLEILETEKVKIGLGICYEMEFPEVVRTLTLKGAEIIFSPSLTVDEYGFWRVRHCCQARAIENQIYVVHACAIGTPSIELMTGWGRSSILSPCEKPWPTNGVIAEAKTNEEMVITADLDLKLLHRKRKSSMAPTLKDRRPEIYEL